MEVWKMIVDLISKADLVSREELESIGGIAASVIADETPKDAPIVVAGCGPRLRIYCLYGEEAIIADGSSEEELSWEPTAGDWRMYLPTSGEEIEWMKSELGKRTNRITAYNFEKEQPGTDRVPSPWASDLAIDIEAFKRL